MAAKEPFKPTYFENLVAFYADPGDLRTVRQFAEDNGISELTVHQFKRDHPDTLWAAVDSSRAKYIPRFRAAAFKSVFANLGKSPADRKLALQLTRDLVELSENKETILTPEDKRARIEALALRLKLAKALPAKEPEKQEAGKQG